MCAKMNKILFYGSFPKKGEQPYGGGEVGNMRTVRMLESAGYEVTKIRKFKSGARWGRHLKILTYPFRLLAGWMVFLCVLLFSSRKNLVHISGFAGATLFNEYVLMHIVKVLGFNALYELRGGGAIAFWEKGSKLYKRMFAYILKNAGYIFVQGKENIPLVESVSTVPCHYYPNYVEDGFAPQTLIPKPNDRINLLFYGRIEEAKHVDMIVEVASIVQRKIPHVYLYVVGNGKMSYLNIVRERMKSLLTQGTYSFRLGCSHDEIPRLLMDKHFYIFPSTQPLEGQSNSVTECMSYGIVPIASPQGFNTSTVGDDLLIVNQLSADEYADRIIGIIQSGSYEKLSGQVRQRYLENYTQKVVTENTLTVYRKILN